MISKIAVINEDWRAHVRDEDAHLYIKPGDVVQTKYWGEATVIKVYVNAPSDPGTDFPLPCWPWCDAGHIGVILADCETSRHEHWAPGCEIERIGAVVEFPGAA